MSSWCLSIKCSGSGTVRIYCLQDNSLKCENWSRSVARLKGLFFFLSYIGVHKTNSRLFVNLAYQEINNMGRGGGRGLGEKDGIWAIG